MNVTDVQKNKDPLCPLARVLGVFSSSVAKNKMEIKVYKLPMNTYVAYMPGAQRAKTYLGLVSGYTYDCKNPQWDGAYINHLHDPSCGSASVDAKAVIPCKYRNGTHVEWTNNEGTVNRGIITEINICDLDTEPYLMYEIYTNKDKRRWQVLEHQITSPLDDCIGIHAKTIMGMLLKCTTTAEVEMIKLLLNNEYMSQNDIDTILNYVDYMEIP